MSIAAYPYTSFSGTILSAQVMANFDHVRDYISSNMVETSGSQTVAGVKTFSSTPVFSAGITVSASGAAITGNSTVTGTLAISSTLTASNAFVVTTGGATITAGGMTITAGNLTMSGGQAIAKRVDDGNSSTADTIDFNAGNLHKSTLTGNCTYTFSNPATGATYVLECLQDATGSRTVTWPAAVVWDNGTAPTLTTTANRKDVFGFLYNGVKYIGWTIAVNVSDTT